MNIVFNNMNEADFEVYSIDCIKDFAEQLTKIRDLTSEEAIVEAQKSFQKSLPNGFETENTHFIKILENDKLIGYFRFEVKTIGSIKHAFAWDLKILPFARGKGLEAMRLAREHIRKLGCKKLSLHVFAKNERTLELYRKLGFSVDSYNMSVAL